MDQQTYIISFENISNALGSIYADDLRETLLDAVPNINVDRQQTNPLAEDFGATLVLILGTPAMIAAVNAIGKWLNRHPDASLSFKTDDGVLNINNISSKDASKLAEKILDRQ